MLHCSTLRGINSELVWDCKAVDDREKSTRKTVVRIECGTGGFCWCVSWDGKTTQTPCVGEVPSEDGSGTESTLGEGQSKAEQLGWEIHSPRIR